MAFVQINLRQGLSVKKKKKKRWKKMQNIFRILYFIISRKVKLQLKCKKRFMQFIEKVL